MTLVIERFGSITNGTSTGISSTVASTDIGFLHLFFVQVAGTITITPPAGYAALYNNNPSRRQAVFWKIVTAAGSPSFTFSASAALMAESIFFSGFDSANPVGVATGAANSASVSSLTVPSLTPTQAGMRLDYNAVQRTASPFPIPTVDAAQTSLVSKAPVANQYGMNIGYELVNPGIPTGTRSYTVSTASPLDACAVIVHSDVPPPITAVPTLPIVSAPTLFAPTVTSSLTTVPSLPIVSAPQLFAPTVISAAVSTPTMLTSAPSTFAPTIIPAAVTAVPALLGSSPNALAPTVIPTITSVPGIATSAPSTFVPTVTTAVTMAPAFLATSPSALAPAILAATTLVPGTANSAGIANPPTVLPTLTATPALLVGPSAPLAPNISTTVTLVPSSASSFASTSPPTIHTLIELNPDFIDGAPDIWNPDAEVRYLSTPGFIASTPQIFAPSVTPGVATVTPALVVSTPTPFAPALHPTIAITPALLVSPPVVLQPNLITAGSVIADPILFTGQVFAPTAIGGPTSLVAGFIAGALSVFAPTIRTSITAAPSSAPASIPQIFAPGAHAILVATPDLLISTPQLFGPHGPKQTYVWFYDQGSQNWYQASVSFRRKLGWGGEWNKADVEIIGAP